MIIVHFKLVFGDTGSYALKTFANFFDGKAAATFIVIAGIGLSLMTNSAIKNNDFKRIRQNRIRIIKRVIFLFLLGLSYLSIWPGDILHSYAAYMLIALIFLRRKPKDIIFGTLSIFCLCNLSKLLDDKGLFKKSSI